MKKGGKITVLKDNFYMIIPYTHYHKILLIFLTTRFTYCSNSLMMSFNYHARLKPPPQKKNNLKNLIKPTGLV